MFKWLRKFFMNYVWLGIVLILTAIVLDLEYPNAKLPLSILIKYIESVGLAILVAAVFTFASGTSEFIGHIRQLLQDIVLSRKFLGNIDADSKREALRALIRPSDEEQRIYSNVEDYYDTYIQQTMSISKKCVRSNYHIHCRVWYDEIKGKVISQETATYRLYPTKDGFNDIKLAFTDIPEDEVPVCDHLIIRAPNGDVGREEPWKLQKTERDDGIFYMAAYSLKEIGDGCPHLDIEIRTHSNEHDHWAALGFQASQPTDGFRYHVQCENDITIQSVHTYSHGSHLEADKGSNKEMFVRCNQWLNEGAGLTVIVSRSQNGGHGAAQDGESVDASSPSVN